MVAALILAAGASSRFGANKLLLPFDGGTVVSTAVANVLGSSARPIVVITGHERAQVEQALAGLAGLGVDFVHNPDYAAGEMLSSIKAGLRHLSQHRRMPEAALMFLGDQPLIPAWVADRLIQAFNRRCGDVIAPRYRFDGPRGHPVLIARAVWPDVLALAPEANVRDLLRARAVTHIAVNTDAILRDVDTPEAYWEARRQTTDNRHLTAEGHKWPTDHQQLHSTWRRSSSWSGHC